MKKIISVVIPCYNLEKYIKKSIESIINQTYKEIEVIVVDDGSIDNSAKICEELERKYSNIKLIKQSNQGVSAARNTGMRYSNGQLIMFLDGDDYLDKECFKEVVQKFEIDNDIDMCFWGFKDIYENGTIERKYEDVYIYSENSMKPQEALLLKSMRKIWMLPSSCMYKRDLLKKYNIVYKVGYKYGEDINFINECISYSKKVGFVKGDFLNYLLRQGSATRSGIKSTYIHASELNRVLHEKISIRTDLLQNQKEIMLQASDVDYIHLTTASAKNVVENLGWFSLSKAKKLYDEFKIVPENIRLNDIEKYLPRAKKLEWNLFCRHKIFFFYTVKFYRMMKR